MAATAPRDCVHGHLARKCPHCEAQRTFDKACRLLCACLRSVERHAKHHHRNSRKENQFTAFHITRALELDALLAEIREFLPVEYPGAEG